jgi:hypothetical protein
VSLKIFFYDVERWGLMSFLPTLLLGKVTSVLTSAHIAFFLLTEWHGNDAALCVCVPGKT